MEWRQQGRSLMGLFEGLYLAICTSTTVGYVQVFFYKPKKDIELVQTLRWRALEEQSTADNH